MNTKSRFKHSTRNHRAAVRLLVAAGAGVWIASCSGGGTGSNEELPPPSLRFEGAENADSRRFDTDADVLELSCDPRLTFLLGPSENSGGLLDNWLLRPRGSCTLRQTQCGFIELSLLDDAGNIIVAREGSSLALVVDLDGVEIDEVQTARARLISGRSGEPFLVPSEDGAEQGEEVMASWELTILGSGDCSGGGGAGGVSGSDGGQGGGAL